MSATKEHHHEVIEKGMRSPKPKAQSSSHKIQWLNLPGYKGETWNPIIGCSKVSEGCKNCYAEKMATRINHIEFGRHGAYSDKRNYTHVVEGAFPGAGWNGKTHLIKSALNKPLHWKKPRVIFVCSMGDMFHDSISITDIDRVFTVMASCPQHIFIVLTKRPENMLRWFNYKDTSWANKGMQGDERIRYNCYHNYGVQVEYKDWKWPFENVWLGVSAENQKQADIRIPFLLQTPAAVRFVSAEPLLAPIDFTIRTDEYCHNMLSGGFAGVRMNEACISNKLDWVICGGESGHNARPMHPDWVRSIRDQCNTVGMPFFFKQWGELVPGCQAKYLKLPLSEFVHKNVQFKSPNNPDKTNTYFKVGKHRSGNLLDGKKHEQYPKLTAQS